VSTTIARRVGRIVVWAGVLFFSAAAALASPIVDEIVGTVSQASYTSYLGVPSPGTPAGILYTHLGDNRDIGGAQHDLARTNILNTFTSLGLNAYLFPFSYGGNTYYDVVGVKPGVWNPSTVYIVGSHYDSVNNPGADDNASGTAGVLEAARVLSRYPFSATLVFIAFDREEQWLIGSQAYANAHAGDSIQGMISLDMIAYNPAGATHDQALLYGRTAPIQNALADSLLQYGAITATGAGILDASDHAPFEWNGKPATLLIEGAVWSNPNYHRAADSVDTLDYIDYDYATRMTRGTVGYLAAQAGYAPEPNCVVLLIVMMAGRRAWRGRRS